MPVNSYEVLFILDSSKTSTGMEEVKGQLHATLDKYGAELVASRPWSEKNEGKLESRLAYPVKGHKKGTYYLTYFKADSQKLTDMEHDFKLNEYILRHMVIAIDPKWDEEMSAVAKDDHRSCLQALREDPEAANDLMEGVFPRRDRD